MRYGRGRSYIGSYRRSLCVQKCTIHYDYFSVPVSLTVGATARVSPDASYSMKQGCLMGSFVNSIEFDHKALPRS